MQKNNWNFRKLHDRLQWPVAFVVAAMMLAGCEHEMEMDYHEAERLYVVEGAVTDENTQIRITRTRPMTGSDTQNFIANAQVVVSSDDGQRDTAIYASKGYYVSATRGVPGKEYRLEVNVGGQRFTSTSVMQPKPAMSSCRMVWKELMSMRLLFLDMKIADFADQTNYYYVHVYRNGYSYRWTVERDIGNPGGDLQVLFACCSDENLNKGSSQPADTDVMCEGDRIRIEVRAIDRRAYDYLSSMEQMPNSGTNPIPNFEGGCLGYFSAYSQLTHNFVFHEKDVEEE